MARERRTHAPPRAPPPSRWRRRPICAGNSAPAMLAASSSASSVSSSWPSACSIISRRLSGTLVRASPAATQLPALARAPERAAGQQMVDHHREEERIARGDPLEGRRRVGRRLARRAARADTRRRRHRRETERQLVTLPPHEELLAQRRDRMVVHDHVDRAVRARSTGSPARDAARARRRGRSWRRRSSARPRAPARAQRPP